MLVLGIVFVGQCEVFVCGFVVIKLEGCIKSSISLSLW